MNRYHFFSMMFFATGVVLFILGALRGEVKTGFIVFIPFLVGTGVYALLGFLFFFIAIFLFMFGFMKPLHPLKPPFPDEGDSYVEGKPFFEGGGVVFIGPIPIVFGSNWRIAIVLMVLAVVLMAAMFLLLNF